MLSCTFRLSNREGWFYLGVSSAPTKKSATTISGSSSEKTTDIWLGSLYPIFLALVAQIFSSLTLLKGQINRRRLNVLLVNIQAIDRGVS